MNKSEPNSRKGKHLCERERHAIEQLLKLDMSIAKIAKTLGRARSTISAEIKRGTVQQLDGNTLTYYKCYSWERGQNIAKYNASKGGRNLAIGNDFETVHVLENLIKQGNSPYAAMCIARKEGKLKTEFSLVTCYKYIHEDILNISSEDLPQGFTPKKDRAKFDERKNSTMALKHQSIEERPKSVLAREEFGHWEGDTVVGKQGTKGVFLTLIERKTRFLISRWLPNRKAETIVRAFDEIEESFGSELFRRMFQSITFDNGKEFSDVGALQSSITAGEKRISNIYFAHPFCSSERGSNEVIHRFIRRKYPKGTSLEHVDSVGYCRYVDWINHYPRGIHDGKCASDLFNNELKAL